MGFLNSTDRARKIAQLEELEARLEKAYAQLDRLLEEENDLEEWRFNSGEGNQWAKSVNRKTQMDLIEKLESKVEKLRSELRSGGIVNHSLRRR